MPITIEMRSVTQRHKHPIRPQLHAKSELQEEQKHMKIQLGNQSSM